MWVYVCVYLSYKVKITENEQGFRSIFVGHNLERSRKVRSRVPKYDDVTIQKDVEEERREVEVVEQLENAVGEYVHYRHETLPVGVGYRRD